VMQIAPNAARQVFNVGVVGRGANPASFSLTAKTYDFIGM